MVLIPSGKIIFPFHFAGILEHKQLTLLTSGSQGMDSFVLYSFTEDVDLSDPTFNKECLKFGSEAQKAPSTNARVYWVQAMLEVQPPAVFSAVVS